MGSGAGPGLERLSLLPSCVLHRRGRRAGGRTRSEIPGSGRCSDPGREARHPHWHQRSRRLWEWRSGRLSQCGPAGPWTSQHPPLMVDPETTLHTPALQSLSCPSVQLIYYGTESGLEETVCWNLVYLLKGCQWPGVRAKWTVQSIMPSLFILMILLFCYRQLNSTREQNSLRA